MSCDGSIENDEELKSAKAKTGLATLPLIRRPYTAPQLCCNFLELLNWQALDSESWVDFVQAGTLDFPNSAGVHSFAAKRYEHYAVAWSVRSRALYVRSVRIGAYRAISIRSLPRRASWPA